MMQSVRALYAALRARWPRRPSRDEILAEYMHRMAQLYARQILELSQAQMAAQERITQAIIQGFAPPAPALDPSWERSFEDLPAAVQEAITERTGRDLQLREELATFAWDTLASDHGNAEDVARQILRGANIHHLLG